MKTGQIQLLLAPIFYLIGMSYGRPACSAQLDDTPVQELIVKCQDKDNSASEKLCVGFVKKMDSAFHGRIGHTDRVKISRNIKDWTDRFVEFDKNKSGGLDSDEFTTAIAIHGHYSDTVFCNLFNRFKNKDENISPDDFILIAAHLETVIDEFKENIKNGDFTLDLFLETITKW